MSNLHVIVGLGTTGFSCARFLHAQGIPFAVTDTRLDPPNLEEFKNVFPEATISLGKLDFNLLNQAAVVVLSPGVALREPEIAYQLKRGVPVIGDIELFAQAVTAPVIAITGTNAKSTVTTLVAKMAEAAGYQVGVGGNLGVPALDLLLNHPNADLYVLELSSFQLETTYSLHPRVATVLNVTPDHMDRYDSVAHYQEVKHRIYLHSQSVVCNHDDPLTDTPSAHKTWFTLQVPQKNEFGLLVANGVTYLAYENELLMPVQDLPVIGRHYQANALASLAICHAFGMLFDPMIKALREFQGLPHRCQFVRERNGVRWYNDSKGTNVGATQAAIEGIGSEIAGKLILIAGGVGKNADFTGLVPYIEKYTRHVVLMGEAAKDLAAAINGCVNVSYAGSMDEAVQAAAKAAHLQDCVLLSPACASFDMFNNYAHRGQVFTEVVNNL